MAETVVCIDLAESIRHGVSLAEVAVHLPLSEWVIRHELLTGALPGFKWGRSWWVYPSDLLAYAEKRGVALTYQNLIECHYSRLRRGWIDWVPSEAFFLPAGPVARRSLPYGFLVSVKQLAEEVAADAPGQAEAVAYSRPLGVPPADILGRVLDGSLVLPSDSVAVLLGLARRQVSQLFQGGAIQGRKMGGRWCTTSGDLLVYTAGCGHSLTPQHIADHVAECFRSGHWRAASSAGDGSAAQVPVVPDPSQVG